MKKVLLAILVLVCMQSAFGGTKMMLSIPEPGYPWIGTIDFEEDVTKPEYAYSWHNTMYSDGTSQSGYTYSYDKTTVTNGPNVGKIIYTLESLDPSFGVSDQTMDPLWDTFESWITSSGTPGTNDVDNSLEGETSGGALDMLVNTNTQAFKFNIFSEKAVPRAAKKDRDKSKPNLGKADISNEFFTMNKVDGNSFMANGGYSRTTEDGKWSFGGNFNFNRISFSEGDNVFNNITLNGTGSYLISETASRSQIGGAVINIIMPDKDLSDDGGFALGGYYSEKLTVDEQIINFGGMFNYASMGDLSTTYLTLAALYGRPINDKFSLNIDAIFSRNISASYDGESVDFESKNALNTGATLGWMISDAFNLNLGARTTLMVKDYSGFELNIGSSFIF